jgi:hypothetical protein
MLSLPADAGRARQAGRRAHHARGLCASGAWRGTSGGVPGMAVSWRDGCGWRSPDRDEGDECEDRRNDPTTACHRACSGGENGVHRAPARLVDGRHVATGGPCSPDRGLGRQMRRSPQRLYNVRTACSGRRRGWLAGVVPRLVARARRTWARATNATIAATTLQGEDGVHRAAARLADRRRAATCGRHPSDRDRGTNAKITATTLQRENDVHWAPGRLAGRHRAAMGGLRSPDRAPGRRM